MDNIVFLNPLFQAGWYKINLIPIGCSEIRRHSNIIKELYYYVNSCGLKSDRLLEASGQTCPGLFREGSFRESRACGPDPGAVPGGDD
jgi:hypothetical protein